MVERRAASTESAVSRSRATEHAVAPRRRARRRAARRARITPPRVTRRGRPTGPVSASGGRRRSCSSPNIVPIRRPRQQRGDDAGRRRRPAGRRHMPSSPTAPKATKPTDADPAAGARQPSRAPRRAAIDHDDDPDDQRRPCRSCRTAATASSFSEAAKRSMNWAPTAVTSDGASRLARRRSSPAASAAPGARTPATAAVDGRGHGEGCRRAVSRAVGRARRSRLLDSTTPNDVGTRSAKHRETRSSRVGGRGPAVLLAIGAADRRAGPRCSSSTTSRWSARSSPCYLERDGMRVARGGRRRRGDRVVRRGPTRPRRARRDAPRRRRADDPAELRAAGDVPVILLDRPRRGARPGPRARARRRRLRREAVLSSRARGAGAQPAAARRRRRRPAPDGSFDVRAAADRSDRAGRSASTAARSR